MISEHKKWSSASFDSLAKCFYGKSSANSDSKMLSFAFELMVNIAQQTQYIINDFEGKGLI